MIFVVGCDFECVVVLCLGCVSDSVLILSVGSGGSMVIIMEGCGSEVVVIFSIESSGGSDSVVVVCVGSDSVVVVCLGCVVLAARPRLGLTLGKWLLLLCEVVCCSEPSDTSEPDST